LIDGRTKIVALSAVSFHNGFTPDLIEIGSLCRDRGVLFCVDAIQALGAIKLDVAAANVSFLASDAHKWLLGPEGTAIFFVAEAVRDQLEVLESGWMNIDRKGHFIGCDVDLLNDGRRFEAGTLNTNGVYGATAALELINEIGIESIEEEVLRMAQMLGDGLEQIGYVLKTPRPYRSGVVAVSAPAHTSENLDRIREQLEFGREIPAEIVLHRWLEEQDIICAPRERMLRFSPHFYNSEEDIDEAISALTDLW
jgi:cysteine desulfurase / selenocysteine lyase